MLGLGPGLEHSVLCALSPAPFTSLPGHPTHFGPAPLPCHLTSPFLYSGFPSIIRMFWILKETKYEHERQKGGPPDALQSQATDSPSFDDVHRHGSSSGDEATDHAGAEVAQNVVGEVAWEGKQRR